MARTCSRSASRSACVETFAWVASGRISSRSAYIQGRFDATSVATPAIGKSRDQFKDKDQRSDVVTLIDLCNAMELPIAPSGGGPLPKADLVNQIVSDRLYLQNCLQLPVLTAQTSAAEAPLQDLHRFRDPLVAQASPHQQLESRVFNSKSKHQLSDVVTVIDHCVALELPISGGWMSKADLVKQIVSAQTSSAGASLQDLRRFKDPLVGQASQHQRLESRVCKFKAKDQSTDAVTLIDLCNAMELPIANLRGVPSKAELIKQIISSSLAEVPVHSNDVSKSSFDIAMALCGVLDAKHWDLDASVKQVCSTVESCVPLFSVLMGIAEEEFF